MHASIGERPKNGWGRGASERRELSNIRMWSTSLLLKLAALPPGKLRRPTDCLSFRYEIIPDWPQVIRGIKEPKKRTDSDSIIIVVVVLVIGIDRKSGAIKVNTLFNDSFE